MHYAVLVILELGFGNTGQRIVMPFLSLSKLISRASTKIYPSYNSNKAWIMMANTKTEKEKEKEILYML